MLIINKDVLKFEDSYPNLILSSKMINNIGISSIVNSQLSLKPELNSTNNKTNAIIDINN